MERIVLIYFFVMNVVAWAAYGIDKYKAVHHMWRIPEATLFTLAILGGPIGALLGMNMFHHKTKKMKFWVINVGMLVLWSVAILWYVIKVR